MTISQFSVIHIELSVFIFICIANLFQIKFRILPFSKHTFMFNLLPVATGLSSLPSLDLTCLRESGKVDMNNIPTSILIKPAPIRTTAALDASIVS